MTLTGIGGVGKTRLALRAAQEMKRAFPDGLCLVELASLTDPALLADSVIDALGLREQSTRDRATVVCDYLRERRMLLVLDSCEHMVGAAADFVDRVLRAAPEVRILVTSRQALRIAGEYVYQVPRLPVPDPDEPIEPGTATRYPSIALFVERSESVVPGFAFTSENEAAVVRLCHRLEGIPLAIELASVRLRVLTVNELANRLDHRFQLLREGSRNLPERHQTLQALIDWSYDLCTPEEQTLWERASVFAGGFDIDALEVVCTDETLPSQAILDTVAGLLDKSIFVREGQDKYSRFGMLETIRAYGQARLAESGREPALRLLHRDWVLQMVETADSEWAGPRQEEWANRLQLERPNLRRALDYCLAEPSEARAGMRLAGVPWFWLAMGHLAEGKLWLDRVLALDAEPTRERAWALATDACLAAVQGDATAATALVEEARALAVRLEDPAALAYTTYVRGVCRFQDTDLAGAIPLFTEALRQYSDTAVAAQYSDLVRMDLATAYVLLGEAAMAAEMIDEILERCRATGERWELSYALWGRGFLKLTDGEFGQAEADLCEAIKIKRAFHDTLGLALSLELLGWTTATQGNADRAATLLGGANTFWKTLGSLLMGSMHLIAQRSEKEKLARDAIGNAQFDAAFERGGAFTVEELLAFALREEMPSVPEAPIFTPALTRREREVADLVHEGLANKDIAARLVISLRTAEGHVENILSKLGFTSRAQIASWVAQQRVD
ncbi:LuxR family transcriptional regulator [Saccharopolyspora tripterygii]